MAEMLDEAAEQPVDHGAEHIAEAGDGDQQPGRDVALQQQSDKNGLRLRRQQRGGEEGGREQAGEFSDHAGASSHARRGEQRPAR